MWNAAQLATGAARMGSLRSVAAPERPKSLGGPLVSTQGYHRRMKVFRGKVVNGRIELPPELADDGTEVTVFVPEGETSFTLSADEVRELQTSIDEISRGEVIDGWKLLEELRG